MPEGWSSQSAQRIPRRSARPTSSPPRTPPPSRGPVGPATRSYLLTGLIACGRRLESAWSNGKPAYRCRHGYISAARPESGRSKNTYVREDQIQPLLAAVAILLDRDPAPSSGTTQITAPDETAALAWARLLGQHLPRACVIASAGRVRSWTGVLSGLFICWAQRGWRARG
jgi:hypothetical protein